MKPLVSLQTVPLTENGAVENSTALYIVGNGDCGQLGHGDDELEFTRLQRFPFFDQVTVHSIACGGMHTVVNTAAGLYTWGCNDDGALGRVGPENVPGRVDGTLDIPCTDMSTGDCHSIAYSTSENTVFYWGCYKVSEHTLN